MYNGGTTTKNSAVKPIGKRQGMRLSIYERYSELKAKGYSYLIQADGVTSLLLEMDELGITGFVNAVGEVVTFGKNTSYEYEEFMDEILSQGLLNIQLVKDTARGRSYYQCNSMFTLTALEV